MNTPNKLTIIRMVLVPIFMLLLLWQFKWHSLAALLVFIAASLTDMFDGKIARKRGLVTDFGKFLDPIADKMLTTAAFLGFICLDIGYGVVWVTLIVLLREFTVSSVRMIAAARGKVIAADKWGKVKTVVQMVSIIMALTFEVLKEALMSFGVSNNILKLTGMITGISVTAAIWISAVLTVVSGLNYIFKNKELLDPSK